MPGKEDEGQEIVKWLAENVSKDLFIHVMEQYHPRAHVGKPRRSTGKSTAVVEPGGVESTNDTAQKVRYQDINRPVNQQEVSSVLEAAKQAGLWRFVEPPRHGGFL